MLLIIILLFIINLYLYTSQLFIVYLLFLNKKKIKPTNHNYLSNSLLLLYTKSIPSLIYPQVSISLAGPLVTVRYFSCHPHINPIPIIQISVLFFPKQKSNHQASTIITKIVIFCNYYDSTHCIKDEKR